MVLANERRLVLRQLMTLLGTAAGLALRLPDPARSASRTIRLATDRGELHLVEVLDWSWGLGIGEARAQVGCPPFAPYPVPGMGCLSPAQVFMLQQQQAAQQQFLMQQQLAAVQQIQVAAYYQALAQLQQQYQWLTQQRMDPMQDLMRNYEQDSFALGSPFAMDSIRSVYCSGTRRADSVLFGLGRAGDRLRVTGKPVRLVSHIQQAAEEEGWDDTEAERAAGPQGNNRGFTERDKNDEALPMQGFPTVAGRAGISVRSYRDEGQPDGPRQRVVVFDSHQGKVTRLVAAD